MCLWFDAYDFITRYQLINGYFVPITNIESETYSTYYAYNILDLLELDDVDSINSYLKTTEETNKDSIYYWILRSELDFNSITTNNRKYIEGKFEPLIKNYTTESEISNIERIYLFLELMKKLDIEIKNKDKILEAALSSINQAYENYGKNGVYVECYSLMILNSIGYEDNSLFSKKKDEFVNKIKNINKADHDELYYLFNILFCLKAVCPENVEEIILDEEIYSLITKELEECNYGSGLFSYSHRKENVSLKSTYYGLFILKHILQKN